MLAVASEPLVVDHSTGVGSQLLEPVQFTTFVITTRHSQVTTKFFLKQTIMQIIEMGPIVVFFSKELGCMIQLLMVKLTHNIGISSMAQAYCINSLLQALGGLPHEEVGAHSRHIYPTIMSRTEKVKKTIPWAQWSH